MSFLKAGRSLRVNMIIKDMSLEELVKLSDDICNEIKLRKKELNKVVAIIDKNLLNEYEFEFNENRFDNNCPFVAKITYSINAKNGIEREFKNLDKTNFGKEYFVCGKYKVKEGEVLEIRDSMARGFCIVYQGNLKFICETNDTKSISTLKRYLREELDINTLLELIGIKEVDTEVLDELKD